ncbi:hypothetical protein DP144_14110 [Clostridium tetani]|uniref:hypothetical protein n=1 Tax=Clostridium tetani TaxID=1513 RepID=UPI00100AEE8E|nr:hypothetical protein [Clostridium tetani]RXM73377.1 hypothetical protein DP154_14075 [Clostridium tetani]RYU97774.1 hypothetical protein DP144_14110 [Clostridium tetani]
MEIILGEKIKFKEQLNLLDLIEGKEDKAVNVEIITPKKLKDITLSYKQMIVLLEALYNFRESVIRLKEDNFENFEKQSVYNHKISEINTLFDYLQEGMKYDFEGMVNKCLNKWIKAKEKEDDPGMETFGWLQEKKEE